MPMELITEEDLDRIYFLIDQDGRPDREPVSVRNATDAEFRNWIVAFGAYHGVQILPVMGRIGMETRVAMLNRLERNGVHIHRQAIGPRRS